MSRQDRREGQRRASRTLGNGPDAALATPNGSSAGDSSERERLQETLRKREQEIGVLADNVLALFSYVDAGGRYQFVNKRYEEWFGTPRTEIIGRHLTQVLGEATYERIREHVEGVLRGEHVRFEDALPYRKGGTRWVTADYVPDTDDAGKVIGFFALVTDITEQKRAEEALTYQAQLLASVNDAIISTDEQFVVKSWNPAAEQIYGWKAEEVLGRPGAEVLRTDYPGAERSQAIEAAVEAGNFYGEVVQYRKDGTPIQIESKVIALRDSRGRTTGYVGVNRDISERKRGEEALREAEGRYRLLFEEAPAMYVISRSEHGTPIITDCNDLFLTTLGYSRAEVLGRPLGDFYAPPSRVQLLEQGGFQRAMEGRFLAEERQLLARDGHVVEALLRAEPELDDDGRTIGTRAMYLDITERKQAEEALRESEERFRTLAEASFEGIAIHDKGKVLSANQTLAAMFGHELPEIIGMHALDFAAPESRGLLLEGMSTRSEEPFEVVGLRKDGFTFVAEIRGRAIPYQGRRVSVAAVRDITARKNAEEALRRERDRAQKYLDLAEVIVVAIDRQERVRLINRKGRRVLGHEEEDILGKNWFDSFLPATTREEVRSTFQKLIAGEIEPEYFENPIVTHTGEQRLIAWHNTVLADEGGAIVATLSSGEDITERRRAERALEESERRYRLLAENATDIIWIRDLNLRTTYVNPAVTRIRGYSVEEVLAQSLEEVLTPASLKLARKALAEEVGRGAVESDQSPPRALEIEATRKDGSTVWLDSKVSALRGDDGRVVGVLGISRDISERKREEGAFREAREELEDRVERRMLQGNAYGLTFRELTVLHLVMDGKSDKEIAGVLGISTLTASKHLANILHKMGAASRTEAGVRAVREGLLD